MLLLYWGCISPFSTTTERRREEPTCCSGSELAHLCNSSLGLNHYRQWIQISICCKAHCFEWSGNISSPRGICSGFGRNILLNEKSSDKSNSNGEIRFQIKPDKVLSDSFTGDSLPGSQVEFSDVSSFPIRGTHQNISQLPLPLSTREISLSWDVSSVTRSEAFNIVSGSPGTIAEEGISELDCATGHSPQEPSQPQRACLTRMDERSLQSPVFSQDRLPSGFCFVEKSDDRRISHGLGSGV